MSSSITFLHLSDLHFRQEWPEQIGLVFGEFIKDLQDQVSNYSNLYLVFSGDLVQAASKVGQYDAFITDIVAELDKVGLTAERRISVPGNHDVSRDALKSKIRTARGAFDAVNEEETFLSELPALKDQYLAPKFSDYISAEKGFAKFGCCQTGIGGHGWELSPNIGVYCLNTALTSFGGIDDPDNGKPIDDSLKLYIDTRSLYQWVQQCTASTKVLVMHHPMEWLTPWAQDGMEKLIAANFLIVFTGHVHKGSAALHSRGAAGWVSCRAPALFTRKNEMLGYSFVTVNTDTGEVVIDYRQWTGSKFVLGVNLADGDSGRVSFQKTHGSELSSESIYENQAVDTGAILEAEFQEASTCYSSKKQFWVQRDLSFHPETAKSHKAEKCILPEDFARQIRQAIIRAPKEFGLTSLGKKIALEHFRFFNQKSVIIVCNAPEIGAHKQGVASYIQTRCSQLKCRAEAISGIILDNWQNVQKPEKLLRVFKEGYPSVPLVILHGLDDFNDISNPSVLTKADGFESLYLRSLSRSRIRELVTTYLEAVNVDLDDHLVTKKIVEDIDALNTHRTPLNCLLLLKLIERSFDDSPVNRTEVIRKVLFALFYEFDQIPTYSSRPDLTDCEFALGYLCEWMLTANRKSFRKDEFFDKVHEYCRDQMIRFDSDILFNFLCSANILIRRGIEFSFRLAYWRFYFTALRMHHSADFAGKILADLQYTAFPEVIEFYTGIDRRRTDAVERLAADLASMDAAFLSRTKIAEDFNPYMSARWNPNEEAVAELHREVTNCIQESALPSEVKDAVADGSYDRAQPYHQEIREWIRTSSLDQMIQALKAAARALRNSDHVVPSAKEALLSAVLTTWTRLTQILIVLSPILATNRSAQFEGMGFFLSDGFEDETDPKRIWNLLMAAIPGNVAAWHSLDLFSKKLGPLLDQYLAKNRDSIGELLVLIILIRQRPVGWKETLTEHIVRAPKNSFLLNRVYSSLLTEIRVSFASEETRQQMRTLAAMAVSKHITGAKHPNQKLIAKGAKTVDDVLAEEDALDEEHD